mmetsp:Transcript_77422/g.69328  ORF Transcript_77422/g.69328 Transcript_77422/m.69328 type:complete len:263 (-) Transcript_77422:130-918(-)
MLFCKSSNLYEFELQNCLNLETAGCGNLFFFKHKIISLILRGSLCFMISRGTLNSIIVGKLGIGVFILVGTNFGGGDGSCALGGLLILGSGCFCSSNRRLLGPPVGSGVDIMFCLTVSGLFNAKLTNLLILPSFQLNFDFISSTIPESSINSSSKSVSISSNDVNPCSLQKCINTSNSFSFKNLLNLSAKICSSPPYCLPFDGGSCGVSTICIRAGGSSSLLFPPLCGIKSCAFDINENNSVGENFFVIFILLTNLPSLHSK